MLKAGLQEAADRLEEIGLKVRQIKGTRQLLTEFPRGYYVAIGEHVAKELAGSIKNNPQITPDQVSDYFRARIFYGAAMAQNMLNKKPC